MIIFLEYLFFIPTKDSTITSIRSTNRSQWGGLSLECWWFSMGRIADTSWRIAREVPGIGDWMGVIHEMIDVFIVIFLCRARLNILYIIVLWYSICSRGFWGRTHWKNRRPHKQYKRYNSCQILPPFNITSPGHEDLDRARLSDDPHRGTLTLGHRVLWADPKGRRRVGGKVRREWKKMCET